MEIDEPPIPKPKTVFIDNMSEDVWPFIEALEDESVKRNEISENAALTDRQYLGVSAEQPEDLVFVAPERIDPAFIDYVASVVGGVRAELLVPKLHLGQLSEDVMSDQRLMDRLGSYEGIKLISYCSSLPWYRLVASLTGVLTPEAPQSQQWKQTVGTFGTKAGLRQALAGQTGVLAGVLPEGEVVVGKPAIIAKALELANRSDGVVIKTNKGHSGMGVVILRPENVAENNTDLSGYIGQKLAESNGYWDKFPTVVEKFIQTDNNVGGGFPNIECRIDGEGRVEVLYVCGMRVSQGVFAGVEIFKDVLPKQHLEQVFEIGQALGELYASNGYRGYFDVDFMADLSGKLYISESNVRRTGGTWAIKVATRLFGEEYLTNRYFVTNLVNLPAKTKWSFAEVVDKLGPILINRNTGNETGVILASANLVPLGKLNYMVVAKSRKQAAEIELKIQTLIA